MLLEVYEKAFGLKWLATFYENNEKRLVEDIYEDLPNRDGKTRLSDLQKRSEGKVRRPVKIVEKDNARLDKNSIPSDCNINIGNRKNNREQR